MLRRPVQVAAVLLGACLLGGCGKERVEAGDVATAVADQVEEQAGARPHVRCPDDLDAEVGASARCTLTLDGVDGTYGVTVEVTEVDDDVARFDVRVDDEPRG